MPVFNRPLYLRRDSLVGDTANVSLEYAAAMGKTPAVLNALLGQVVAVEGGEHARLHLEPVNLFRLRRTVLLELNAIKGHIDYTVLGRAASLAPFPGLPGTLRSVPAGQLSLRRPGGLLLGHRRVRPGPGPRTFVFKALV